MNPNNIFGNLSTDGLEEAKDVLGGSKFGVLETDVYGGEIKLAYAGQSDRGARFLDVTVALDNGQEYNERLYVTNAQGENFYHPKDKSGNRDTSKKNPLPGFTNANDIALLATGYSLGEQEVEEKIANLYNFDQKKEIPTKVPALVSLHGKRIKLAIQKSTELKTRKNDTTNQYEPIGDGSTRDTNAIEKVFHDETGRTVSEVTAQQAEGEFLGKWLEKNKGVTRDKTGGAQAGGAKTGVPGGAAPTAGAPVGGKGKSLFG